MRTPILFSIAISIFFSTLNFGQLTVKDQELTPNILLQVNDEGSAGSLTLGNIGIGRTGFKLYNNGGDLYWGNSQLNGGSGATAINDLIDAKYDGSSLFLGQGAGLNDDGNNQNTAIGKNALGNNENGDHNTAIGSAALSLNTTGIDNTAIGTNSISQNTSGIYNTAIGAFSLSNNSTGTNNTANGTYALNLNTEGSRNTVNGFYALYNNTEGNENVVIGSDADSYNQTGSKNTIIGFQAGLLGYLHNKSGNVFLGYQAGFIEPGSNLLYIENSMSTSPLIWGDFGNDIAAVHGKLGISTKAPTSKIDIEGSKGFNQLRLRDSYTPENTGDTNGEVGDITWDEDYFYVKTAAGWKRAALSTWTR